jgi:hypothetical protein
MKRMTLEIECDGDFCGGCGFMFYSPSEGRACDIFMEKLVMEEGMPRRCGECRRKTREYEEARGE